MERIEKINHIVDELQQLGHFDLVFTELSGRIKSIDDVIILHTYMHLNVTDFRNTVRRVDGLHTAILMATQRFIHQIDECDLHPEIIKTTALDVLRKTQDTLNTF